MHNIKNNSSQLSQGIWCLESIYFTFPTTFVMIVLSSFIYPNGPIQSNPLSYSCISLPLHMHQLHLSLILPLDFIHFSPSSTNFPLSPTNSQDTQNILARTRKPTRRKPWNLIAIWHHKQSGKALHQMQSKPIIKLKQITKYRRHKTSNKHRDSIPMLPSASKGKFNLSLLQHFMVVSFSMQFPGSYYHTCIVVSV